MLARETADIVVIGAGMMGSAIALGLTRNGLDVLVLDEGDVAFRAARGNFGLVWVQSKGANAPEYARLTRRSAMLWPDFSARLEHLSEVALHFEQKGGLTILLDDEEVRSKQAMMAELSQINEPALEYEMLDAAAARTMMPCLGPSVAGACYSPADGHVNPLLLLRAMHKALDRQGARLASSSMVRSIGTGQTGNFLIECDGKHIEAERIVIAAGLGTTKLASFVGMDVPVTPQRGQLLVTSRVRKLMDIPTLTVRQTDNGSIMIGESWEDAGLDDTTTRNTLQALAKRALSIIPELEDAPVVRTWAALRILTPDGLPIYAQSASHPGAFAVTCHSGVTLAAMHAGPLADGIACDRLTMDFGAFSAERLHVH